MKNIKSDFRFAKEHKKGFTLIELLCVIAIIAFLFSSSIPILSKTSKNFQLKSKANKIKALCSLIKQTSIIEKNAYKLLINYNENSYTVFKQDNNRLEKFHEIKDSIFKKQYLPKAIYFYSDNNILNEQSIIFNSNGKITSSKVLLKNNQGNIASISTSLSGEINLEFL